MIDIGTGGAGGFPGVPLKIAYPNSFLTLVESIKKESQLLRGINAGVGFETGAGFI